MAVRISVIESEEGRRELSKMGYDSGKVVMA
jgi:hypothetical protein